MNPYIVVEEFEKKLSDYTGAPYVACVDSCTNAIFLICKRLGVEKTLLPKHTYLSIPMSVIHSGGEVEFEDREWKGMYQIKPYPIWDSAKRLKRNMYMTPEQAIRGIQLMDILEDDNPDLIEDPPYRDLTTYKVFSKN